MILEQESQECSTSTISLEERTHLEEKCSKLRKKLRAVQKRRRAVRQLNDNATTTHIVQWIEQQNDAMFRNAEALNEYRSVTARRKLASSRLQVARSWNTTNDCFYIWHSGPFGTINGLRLGSEPPCLGGEGGVEHVDTSGSTTHLSAKGDISLENSSSASNGESIIAHSVKVPWVEINSALGMVALLLSTLEQKPHSCIHFTNEIFPMGSCSKIGLRRGDSSTVYNLCSDDSFKFFGERNFNIALNALLKCLADAFSSVSKRDRTIAFPHPIDISLRGVSLIGGLSISYGNNVEQWTRAMKYLLTDLKWLVAFTTKHVDI